jgi:hypothetical protein
MMEPGDRAGVAPDTVILIVSPKLEYKETMLFFYTMSLWSSPILVSILFVTPAIE